MELEPDLAAEHEALLQFVYLCPHGVAQFDQVGTIGLLNPAFACLTMPLLQAGQTYSNLIALFEPCLPDLRSMLEATDAEGLICDGLHVHLGAAAPGQSPRVLSLTVVRMSQGRHMAVLSDVTRQVAQERRLRESDAWFTAFVQGADNYAILGVDASGLVCQWNETAERLFGYQASDVVGMAAGGLVTSGKPDQVCFADRLHAARLDGWHLDDGWRIRADGSRFWGTCMVSPIEIGIAGDVLSPTRYLMIVRDVTEQRSAVVDLRRALTLDHLTGVTNRRCFLDQAERELRRKRPSAETCYVAMVDADHFKSINDTYGHAAGDRALKAVAEVLQACCRDGGLVGRLGGEEFGVLIPATNSQMAEQVAEQMCAGVAALKLMEGERRMPLTVSIGVAGNDHVDLKDLLKKADAALYGAKDAGRNRVCLMEHSQTASSTTMREPV